MKILVTALLSNYKLHTNLMGMINSKKVSEIILLRRWPLHGATKVRNVNPSGIWKKYKLVYELWRFVTIMRILLKEDVNAIIGIQMVLHGMQAAIAGFLTRTPFILSAIGSDIYVHTQKRWERLFLKWAFKRSDAILVKGTKSKKMLLDAGISPNKIFVSQDYQDEKRFTPKDMEKRWDLLFIGSLLPVKRVHALIDAVARVCKDLKRIRLGILGDGPEQDRLERLVQDLGIVENVDFIGRRNDVENYINASRVVILVSRSEGMPAAAIESIFCGVPVVLTDVGDIKDIFIHGENALLVPVGDKWALVAAIRQLLTDDELYEHLREGALKTRERHIQRWNLEGQVREWERVLRIAIQSKN
jgi:glycosyltransferase involved in cell wall biosynthesis